ncbi:MAG TPA: hypothetical protein VD905_01185 [Flavobacteriales bacterium]|nr:hypothetical protein [Flavobacteriales bacterium]
MAQEKSISAIGLATYVAGVELAFVSRQVYVFNIIVCQKKKNKLEPVLQKHNLSFEELKPLLKNVSSFHLVITGKVVVYRRLSTTIDRHSDLIHYILPDAHPDDFIAQYQTLPDMRFGALIRKDLYRSLLEPFAHARLYPDSVLIGPYILKLFSMVTGLQEALLDTINYQVPYGDGLMAIIIDKDVHEPFDPKTFQSGKETINAYCMPALCALLNADVEYLRVSITNDPETAKLTNEAKQKRRFRRLLTIIVPVIFAIVTVNFFFNQHLSDKRNAYDEQLALNQQQLNEINKLEKDIEGKKALLGKRTGNQGPVLSILGDQLAATVPAKIKLKNLEIFPMNGKIQKERPMAFVYNKITVEGISSESEVLDNWIKKCRKIYWIKDVSLVKYTFDPDKRGIFKIELILQ